MEPILNDLIAHLQSTLASLEGPLKNDLQATIHAPSSGLPDKKLVALASEAEELLDRVQKLLQPPVELLADNFLGYLDSKCLCAAVSLRIPDLLSTGAKTVSALADESDADPTRLTQILRLLRNNGIFAYDESTGTYSNNAASELLRTDHWTQWHRWVDLYGNEFYDMARGIPRAVMARNAATRTAAQLAFGTDKSMFDYASEHGWLERLLGTIGAAAVAQAPGIVEDYPWGEVVGTTVLDVGGGSGDFIGALLREFPTMKGAVLDTAQVIERVTTPSFRGEKAKFADVGGRVTELIAGDFLQDIPPFEVYTMKWCLHDWGDEDVLKVLKNARKAIVVGPNSRFVIIESVLTEGRKGRLARLGDVTMMVAAGGRERTYEEWKDLAERSGWRLAVVRSLRNAWPSAIELRPA